jgi:hypothetical protein
VHSTDPDDLDAPLAYHHEPIDPAAATTSTGRQALTGPARCLRALEALDRYATVRDIQNWDADNPPAAGSRPLTSDTVRKALQRLAKDGKIHATQPPAGAAVHYAHPGLDAPATSDEPEDEEPW